MLTPCVAMTRRVEQNAQHGFGLRRRSRCCRYRPAEHDELDAEAAQDASTRSSSRQRSLALAVRLPERRLHEEVAGERADVNAVCGGQVDDLAPPVSGHQRILAQPLVVERPFDQSRGRARGAGKFVAPVVPREGLNLAVDLRRQPALHEADASLSSRVPLANARPFAVQPPSTNSSCPVT